MTDHLQDVSVVILSYNRPHLLRQALDSLIGVGQEVGEVILIDNESPASPEIRRLVQNYPTVNAVFNSDNRGYTGGMNQGILLAKRDYVFLTEDDIIIGPGCLMELKSALLEDPSAVLAAPVVRNLADRQILCSGGEFRLDAIWKIELCTSLPQGHETKRSPIPVGFVAGATFLTYRKTLFQEKGFRDDFVLYLEDVELCLRHIRAGRKMVVVPSADAMHFEPATGSGPNPFVQFHQIKNLFALYLLHARSSVLIPMLLRYSIWILIRETFAGTGSPMIRIKAILWTIRSLPRLLADRRQLSRRFSGGPKAWSRSE